MKIECLTVVFVDIEGYTSKTNDQSRGANERLLGRFAALVKPLVRAFNGRIVKGMGDAYLVVFKSPTDALLCAMAVQDLLAERSPQLPKHERFRLRFAASAGEVRVEHNDVFGEAVNIASRIEALASGGEIYFSEAVYLMMNRSEVPFLDAGRHKLKGIHEQVRLYRIPKLSEVGAYKLAPPVEAKDGSAEPELLPFGGLALKRVHSRVTEGSVAKDGSFYLLGALAEVHYTSGSKSALLARRSWPHKILAPFYYLSLFAMGVAAIPFHGGTYRGLYSRFRKGLRLFKGSRSYRFKVITNMLLLTFVLGGTAVGWRQYVLAKQAEQQAETLKILVQQKEKAAAQARAREVAVQKALNKEKKKFHFPW
ncbi:MAG TPA: adenylate/guanylate cyclase domain-containing protein [bacterium]|jgi:adenylate cyclase|nr:adenylate/guanylate cyclase domain-containing protein [bacterium]